jgi:hypothetical protein
MAIRVRIGHDPMVPPCAARVAENGRSGAGWGLMQYPGGTLGGFAGDRPRRTSRLAMMASCQPSTDPLDPPRASANQPVAPTR